MKRFLLLLGILCIIGYAQVRWSLDGVRISVSGAGQDNAQCVSDMNYGAIVAWEDNRYNSTAYDIFAQRVDSSGNLLWTPGGVPVCVDILNSQESIVMCSDEAGGAIIVWQDYRNATGPDLYAQRIDGSGNCLWQVNGVPICTAVDQQGEAVVVSDGGNGAIVIWVDWRDPNPIVYKFIYAQRIDGIGNVLWASDGVPIDTAHGFADSPAAEPDNNGGAYVVWERDTVGTLPTDLFFQHIDSLGNSLLANNGLRLFRDTLDQYFPKLVWSGQNAMIAAWEDYRNWQTTGADIYALRFDTLGNPLWDSTGLPVCTADSIQGCAFSNLISDGSAGAIICWQDRRNGNPDVYAQRIDINGYQIWRTNGIPVCSLPGVQYVGPGVSDDSMGVIFKWPDDRNGLYEEYFQRIGPDGIERWTPQGVRACTVSVGNRAGGPALSTDGKGGAITVWTDSRYGSYNTDIWGQRLNDGHQPGVAERDHETKARNISLELSPNPFTHFTYIRYQITDNSKNANLDIYDATGRRVKSFNQESSIENPESEVMWDGRDYAGKQLPNGVYFCRLVADDMMIVRKVILLRQE